MPDPTVRRPVRSSHRRAASAAGVVIALVGIAAGCGSGGGDGDRLTIYSGRQEQLVGPLLERFAEETDIRIDVRYGDSAELALLIETEGDRSPADVFFSQSSGAVDYLDDAERLVPLPEEVLGRVPAPFRSGDGHWIGVSARVRTLVYNTAEVAEDDLPASVFELTEARFRDRVGVAPTNASFQDFVTAMRGDVGDERTLEFLQGLRDNGARTYANNVAIVQAVGRGEIPMGLVNHYYREQAAAEDPDLEVANHFFGGGDLGGMVLVSAASVLDTAGDAADAQRFVDFLLTAESQRYFSEETFEYPLVDEVEPAGDLPALDELESPAADLGDLGTSLTRTRELIEESGLTGG